MRRVSKSTVRTSGIGLIIIGVIFVVISLTLATTVYNCPANGCGPEVHSAAYWDVIFFTGTAFIAIGIVLLSVARRMKPETETADSRPRQRAC